MVQFVITLTGFERKYEVFTDQGGAFTYGFGPLAGEASGN
jgi:hypothetical protein